MTPAEADGKVEDALKSLRSSPNLLYLLFLLLVQLLPILFLWLEPQGGLARQDRPVLVLVIAEVIKRLAMVRLTEEENVKRSGT